MVSVWEQMNAFAILDGQVHTVHEVGKWLLRTEICNCDKDYNHHSPNFQLEIFSATCFPSCANGGMCFLPGYCFCAAGFAGYRCELQIQKVIYQPFALITKNYTMILCCSYSDTLYIHKLICSHTAANLHELVCLFLCFTVKLIFHSLHTYRDH